jgi:chromosomal replication initiation ATPase DnaA
MQTGLTLINDQPGRRHMAEVCAAHGLTREQMRGWNKTQKHVNARKDLWFRLVIIEQWSLPEAGRMTRKDHTTVLYGLRRYAAEILGTPPKASLAEIREAYHNRAAVGLAA